MDNLPFSQVDDEIFQAEIARLQYGNHFIDFNRVKDISCYNLFNDNETEKYLSSNGDCDIDANFDLYKSLANNSAVNTEYYNEDKFKDVAKSYIDGLSLFHCNIRSSRDIQAHLLE